MFRFRLQRVLELREKREQAQAIELAKAEESAATARQQRDDLQALRTASRETMSSAHGSAPTVGHLHHLGFVLSALDERLGHASKTVTLAETFAATARVSLEAAARDRRVLDRLKDKHEGEHRALETHRDRMMMDEIALARFTRLRGAKLANSSTDSGSDTAKAATATSNATSTTSDRVSDA